MSPPTLPRDTDLGGVSIQTVGNLNRIVKPKAGTRDVYVAVPDAGVCRVE
jgi:hypothetical protein